MIELIPLDIILNILLLLRNARDFSNVLVSLPKRIYKLVQQNNYFYRQRTLLVYDIDLDLLSGSLNNREKYVQMKKSLFSWKFTEPFIHDEHYWDRRLMLIGSNVKIHSGRYDLIDKNEKSIRSCYTRVMKRKSKINVYYVIMIYSKMKPYEIELIFKYISNPWIYNRQLINCNGLMNELELLPRMNACSFYITNYYHIVISLIQLFSVTTEIMKSIIDATKTRGSKAIAKLTLLVVQNKIYIHDTKIKHRLFTEVNLVDIFMNV